MNEMLNVSKDLEPMIGTDPSETTLGTIVTTRQDSLRKEFSILLYDSNGTNSNSLINRTIDVKLNGVNNKSAIRHYVIDQHSGNPARLWRDEMNLVKYPTPEQFQVCSSFVSCVDVSFHFVLTSLYSFTARGCSPLSLFHRLETLLRNTELALEHRY